MSSLSASRERLAVTAVILSMTGAGFGACSRMASPPQQESPVMLTITSKDGTRIAYSRSGSGPPLVLVHGTTADRTRWSRVVPELEPHFTVYALDRRGRGASGDAVGYAIEREFEDVAAVIDAIDEPVFLLGHSYGAICSLEASILTDKVRRLVLYEPPIPIDRPVYPPGVPERIQALVDAGDGEAALEVFFREVVRMPDRELDVYRTLPAWKVRITLAPTIPRELTIERGYRFQPERFAQFSIPTLLLLGGDSPPLFRQTIDMISAALPTSRIVVMPGQQHVAMDTAPELFLKEVIGFLSGQSAGSAAARLNRRPS
jgi:pimeloyl-ACP methyl ester carboxylesterase